MSDPQATYDDVFSEPALPDAPGAETITQPQADRLKAIARREGGHSLASRRRMLRFYGYERAEQVRPARYDDLCELASREGVAARFQQEAPVTTTRDSEKRRERPHVTGADSPEDFYEAKTLADASDEWLRDRLEARLDEMAAGRGARFCRQVGAERYLPRQAAQLRPIVRELTWRLDCYDELAGVLGSLRTQGGG
jgi:hypothetical protein